MLCLSCTATPESQEELKPSSLHHMEVVPSKTSTRISRRVENSPKKLRVVQPLYASRISRRVETSRANTAQRRGWGCAPFIRFCVCKGAVCFPASAPARGKPTFQTPTLHLSIHNFLLSRNSGAVFKELRLVKGMRLEAGDVDGMEGPSRKTTKCLYLQYRPICTSI